MQKAGSACVRTCPCNQGVGVVWEDVGGTFVYCGGIGKSAAEMICDRFDTLELLLTLLQMPVTPHPHPINALHFPLRIFTASSSSAPRQPVLPVEGAHRLSTSLSRAKHVLLADVDMEPLAHVVV